MNAEVHAGTQIPFYFANNRGYCDEFVLYFARGSKILSQRIVCFTPLLFVGRYRNNCESLLLRPCKTNILV